MQTCYTVLIHDCILHNVFNSITYFYEQSIIFGSEPILGRLRELQGGKNTVKLQVDTVGLSNEIISRMVYGIMSQL